VRKQAVLWLSNRHRTSAVWGLPAFNKGNDDWRLQDVKQANDGRLWWTCLPDASTDGLVRGTACIDDLFASRPIAHRRAEAPSFLGLFGDMLTWLGSVGLESEATLQNPAQAGPGEGPLDANQARDYGEFLANEGVQRVDGLQ